MIEIITFFKIDDQFIKVDDFEGPLPKSFFDEGIPYIEGAIQLNVDGVLLIDTSMWDFVDQLWSYILAGVYELSESNSYKVYFPDQPIDIMFNDLNKMFIELKIGDNRVVAEKTTVIPALLESGLQFFKTLSILLPDDQTVLNEIEKAENALINYR
jgi:hypothetical protein